MTEILRRSLNGEDSDLSNFDGDLPDWLKKILLARGVSSIDQLSSDLSRLHPPQQMLGMDVAVELLAQALTENKKILIVGDYDADGATSCALAVRALRSMGATQVDFLVPDRFKFGYGLSPEIVEVARCKNPDLLVTVDNGISSIEGVRLAKSLGMNVLITDHHLPGEQLPIADAIINPNQPGCSFPSKNLAGVGVLFNLMVGLRSLLRDKQWFEDQDISEPNLAMWLDIVALGTVADLVPLDEVNRLMVAKGLELIRSGRGNPGIRAILEVAGKDWRVVQSSDLGFAVGPRINAAGRLEDISLGIKCLLTEDESEARGIASQLQQLNQDRRAIEQQMRQEAESALQSLDLNTEELPWGLCLYQQDWHSGVVGLIASRIKDRWHRPTFVFAAEDDGRLKGSGRSISGLHIRDALEAISTRRPELIDQFGGHAMAAGLSIGADKYQFFAEEFDREVRARLGQEALIETILTDGELPSEAINLNSAKLIEDISPWGQAFPEPVFEGEFEIESVRILSGSHLKMRLKIKDETQLRSKMVEAIWFSAPDSYLNLSPGTEGRFIYRLQVNRYRGNESEQILIQDFQSA